jgi:hypothetical protein
MCFALTRSLALVDVEFLARTLLRKTLTAEKPSLHPTINVAGA